MRRSLAVWLGLGVLGMLAGACSALRDMDRLSAGASPDAGAAGDTGGALPAPDAAVTVDAANPPDAPTTGVSAIYWLGSQTVRRSGPNGEDPRVLLSLRSDSFLRSIAVDDAHQKIYFTGTKKVQRANFDGSGLMDVVVGLDEPMGIDVDSGGGKIYYVDQGAAPSVFRANLDGSSAETIVSVTIRHPYGVAVFADEGRLYFTDDELDAVFSANLDGTRLDRLPIAGISFPGEIDIDPVARKLYWKDWTDKASGTHVRRANLDGSGAEVVVSQSKFFWLAQIIGVCVDPLGGRIYFTDSGLSGPGRVLRTDLDGAAVEILVGRGSEPLDLALAR